MRTASILMSSSNVRRISAIVLPPQRRGLHAKGGSPVFGGMCIRWFIELFSPNWRCARRACAGLFVRASATGMGARGTIARSDLA